MDIEADGAAEALDLNDETVVAFEGEEPEQTEGAEETVIAFGDEPGEGEEETPLVKRLRDQLRQTQRQLRTRDTAAQSDDPEPVIPARKRIEDFEYDPDKFDAYDEERANAIQAHAEWKVRQAERETARKRASEEQSKQVEQQRRALGVSDYEDRVNVVRDRLSDQQMALLINATDNPAKVLYALGRSEMRLDELAGIDNLAKFAARVGQLEKEIKVTKRKAPPPETQVRGATASTALATDDKYLAQLEREAERTGDRSKVIAYNRQKRQQEAA